MICIVFFENITFRRGINIHLYAHLYNISLSKLKNIYSDYMVIVFENFVRRITWFDIKGKLRWNIILFLKYILKLIHYNEQLSFKLSFSKKCYDVRVFWKVR